MDLHSGYGSTDTYHPKRKTAPKAPSEASEAVSRRVMGASAPALPFSIAERCEKDNTGFLGSDSYMRGIWLVDSSRGIRGGGSGGCDQKEVAYSDTAKLKGAAK